MKAAHARILALAALAAAAACAPAAATEASRPALPPGAEAMSLLGQPLRPPALPAATRERYEQRLAEAEADYRRDSTSADAIIWLGRRTAYLGRYRDAIDIFSRGIRLHPRDARLWRHRGHRWVSVRELDRAVADLARAAELVRGTADEVEPDGIPNPSGIPTSTLQFNIWYHLGLAHYLRGDFQRAADAYRECMAVSANDDSRVATAHWQYMTLRRLGREADAAALLAAIPRDASVIENDSYLRLLRLYRGELTPEQVLASSGGEDPALDDATLGYGLGNWYLYTGRRNDAVATFRRVIAGPSWAAFGYLAAEAELARLR
ncbi:MAG TPA: tetratricopeptide repeat protein [Gemmatimonadaceae bacterium]|nr:tetratricopeptide repeat protein [Gemmatimonadaceae bacterium]